MSRSRVVDVAAIVAALVVMTPGPVAAEPAASEWHVTEIAGIGQVGFSGDGGPATEARIGDGGIAAGPDGSIHLADEDNYRLRRIAPDGLINSVVKASPGLGPASLPVDVTVAADGTTYLATTSDIRRINKNGSATVLAKSDSNVLAGPFDITTDDAGAVYYVGGDDDAGWITRIERNGNTRRVVQVPKYIHSVAVDDAGTVYYTEGDANCVPTGSVVHAVKRGGATTDVATLSDDHAAGNLAIDSTGALHVLDTTIGQLQRVDSAGDLTPVGPTLGGVSDFAFGPRDEIYVEGGAEIRRLDRGAPESSIEGKAKSRWAADAPGTVHHVAGSGHEPSIAAPGLAGPSVARDGTVYVAEPRRNAVHAIGRNGKVTHLAGTGEYDPRPDRPSPDGRPAVKADLPYPNATAVDADGNVYVALSDSVVRIDREGITHELVEAHFSADYSQVQFNQPISMGTGPDGALYYPSVTDVVLGVVNKLAPGGKPTVVAGSGSARGGYDQENKPAAEAVLSNPASVAVGPDGTVYFTESVRDGAVHVVWTVRRDGRIATVAGNPRLRSAGWGGFSGDGGPASRAELNNPGGLAVGPDGSLYIADTNNNRIRRVDDNGVMTTVAGSGRRGETGDGGPATRAALLDPQGLAVGADGTLYVTSTASGKVRKIEPDGIISTLADVTASAAEQPVEVYGLSVDPAGTVYLGGDAAVNADGALRQLDGLFGYEPVAAAPDGSVYQAYLDEKETVVRRRFPDGTVLRVASDQTLPQLRSHAVGPDGTLYLATASAELLRLDDNGKVTTMSVPGDRIDRHAGIADLAVGTADTIYVTNGNRVIRVRDGKAESLAGNGEYNSADESEEDGGPATEASLNGPGAVAVTEDGTVFVATDEGIRRVDSDGTIETISREKEVIDLAVGPSGDLYVATDGQVSVIVRPAEVDIDRTPWIWLWLATGALVLAAAGVFVLRARRTRRAGTPTEQSTVDDEPAGQS